MFQKSCAENQNPHFTSIFSAFFESRSVYEIMQKDMVEPYWPEMTI